MNGQYKVYTITLPLFISFSSFNTLAHETKLEEVLKGSYLFLTFDIITEEVQVLAKPELDHVIDF